MCWMSRAARIALVWLAVMAALSSLFASYGCEATVRSASVNASRAAVPVVVDESLAAFEDAQNRKRLEEILGTAEMQGAIQEAAHAVVAGALAPGADDRIQATTAQLTSAVTDVLARDIRDKIIPASVDGLRTSLREATSDDRRALLGIVNQAVTEATAASIRSASAEIPQSLAPALRASMVDSLNSPELHAAIASMTADATRSALISSRDVIIQLEDREGPVGPVIGLVDRLERIMATAVVATFLVGGLLGAFLVWIVTTRHRHDPSGGSGPDHRSRLDPERARAS
jgi:hypothetical protein